MSCRPSSEPRSEYACYYHGHLVYYVDGEWYYEDGERADHPRPCPRCGRLPLEGGEDACLGHLPGVRAACCGHGVTEPYVMEE